MTQFILFLTWYDFRLALHNMKRKEKLVFSNTKTKENTTNDDKSFTVARRDSVYDYSETDVKDNIFLFSGSDNPFVMSRSYDVEWICDYDMRWYPFDTQVRI